MRIQDVLRAEKTGIAGSDWGTGKFPKTRFPLSKAGRRAYNLGSAWRWRFVDFEALGQRFVIRVIYSETKARATAHLALRTDRDCVVLCCYEYHPDLHTGWHLHTLCGDANDIEKAPTGTLVHGPWVKRLPRATARHNRTAFCPNVHGGMEAWLWREVMRFFGVEKKDPLL
jgi:hypothetical protein